MKTIFTYILEAVSLGAVSYGFYEISRPAGLIVGGISAFAYAQQASK